MKVFNIPCVITSDEHSKIFDYLKYHKDQTDTLLQAIYFNEEEYYQERKYPFYTVLVFKYGYRNDNKPTLEELDRLFWNILIE